MSSGSYQDLEIWQRAMDLAASVYKASVSLPRDEIYGMTAQMRRAAVSVASNIAEGWGRNSDREFIRFLQISHGSLRELETQLMLAKRIEYLKDEDIREAQEQITILCKQQQNLIRYLNNKLNNSNGKPDEEQ